MKYRKIYKRLAEQMDAREKAIQEAKKIHDSGKKLPMKFRHMILNFDEIPWRKDKAVKKKLRMAAKRICKGNKQ